MFSVWFKGLWPKFKLSLKSVTYFSMAEMCLVSNLPLVSSSGVILPSKSRPSLAIFTRMRRTSSPMYIPLTIFSNLRHTQDKQTLFFPNRQLFSSSDLATRWILAVFLLDNVLMQCFMGQRASTGLPLTFAWTEQKTSVIASENVRGN